MGANDKVEATFHPARPMTMREMQRTQPWDVAYTDEFYYSIDRGERHRVMMHDLMHLTKSIGILCSIAEWYDHGMDPTTRVSQQEFENRLADLVMCAMHISNHPPRDYNPVDLFQAVVTRVNAVNGTNWGIVP